MEVLTKSIPPGLTANETEFYWDGENLMALHEGHKLPFFELPSSVIERVKFQMEADEEAMKIFEADGPKLWRDRLFVYVKCRFGGFSFEPDLTPEKVSGECWNCGCGGNCILQTVFRGKLKVDHGVLTRREIQVIRSLTNDTYRIGEAIASELDISASTLNKHKRSIYDKVGVESIQELAVWASKMNL
jgi:DNA-binding CsgD family transcriptional regulator